MSQMTFQANEVLRLLRQLPPRERLRVVARALPELERVMPANPPIEISGAGSTLRRWLKRSQCGLSKISRRCWAGGPKTNRWMTFWLHCASHGEYRQPVNHAAAE